MTTLSSTGRGEHTPGIVERLRAILPLLDGLETGQDCEEYAFAKANGFQAMTYCPEAFEALRCIPEAADLISELVGALENFCQAAEYWAGCDEGCSPDAASSEIMSGGGAWPAEAYDRARDVAAKARGGAA